MHVIDEAGNIYRGGDAYIFLNRAFNRPFSALLKFHPFKALVDIAYWIVSNNRTTFAHFLYAKEKWVD